MPDDKLGIQMKRQNLAPIILLFLAPLYFFNAFAHIFPTGFAGLFSLISEELANNSFLLPDQIPFYGPGGIPFSYPPVGFYFMGYATRYLNITSMTYLRFAPAVFSFGALILSYYFFKNYTHSRLHAITATFLFGISPVIFYYNVRSGGVVRGLAYFFSMAFLLFLNRSLKENKRIYIFTAGISLGLTILTHLQNAVFLFISLAVFVLVPFNKNKIKISLKILLLALSVISPWLWITLYKHGLQVFLYALNSHGNLSIVWRILHPLSAESYAGIFYSTFHMTPVLLLLCLLGLLFSLLKKQWDLLIWFFAVFIFMSDSTRILIIIGSLIAGYSLFTIYEFIPKKSLFVNICASICLFLLLIINSVSSVTTILNYKPAISNETIQVGQWVQENTPPESIFLTLAPNEETAEWFPFLTQRTPLVGHWGSEWTSHYKYQKMLGSSIFECYKSSSWLCITDLLEKENLSPGLLILLKGEKQLTMLIDMDKDPQLINVFENQIYKVYLVRYSFSTIVRGDRQHPALQQGFQ